MSKVCISVKFSCAYICQLKLVCVVCILFISSRNTRYFVTHETILFSQKCNNFGVVGSCGGAWQLSVPGHPIIWTLVGQGPAMPAVGADESCLDIFLSRLSYFFLPLLCVCECRGRGRVRYRLKYCLKGP